MESRSIGARLQTPLIDVESNVVQGPPKETSAWPYNCKQLWSAFVNYWNLTTNTPFLESWASRRPTGAVLWLIISIPTPFFNYSNFGFQNLPVPVQVAEVLLYPGLMLSRYLYKSRKMMTPIQHEFCIMFVYLIYSIVWRVWMPFTTTNQNEREIGFVLMGVGLGMHAFFTLAYLGIMVTTLLATNQAHRAATILGLSFTVPICTAFLDYTSGKLYLELKENQYGIEQLLDNATDGHCEVDVVSGIMTNASTKLSKTLQDAGNLEGKDACSLKGQLFADGLRAGADRGHVESLLQDARFGRDVSPIMITCTAHAGAEFDARLIPYSTSTNSLKVCMQVLGEARPRHTTFPGPAGAPRAYDDQLTEMSYPLSPPGSTVAALPFTSSEQHTSSRSVRTDAGSSQATSLNYSVSTLTSRLSRRKDQSMMAQYRSVETQTLALPPKLSRKLPPRLPSSEILRRKPEPRVHLESPKRLIKKFRATPATTVNGLIGAVMAQSNCNGKGCCSWHIAVYNLLGALSALAGRDCSKFEINSDWQCSHCFAMHAEDPFSDADPSEAVCNVCQGFRHEMKAPCDAHAVNSAGNADDDADSGSQQSSEAESSTSTVLSL